MTGAEEQHPPGQPAPQRTRIVLAEVSRSGSPADRTRSELTQQTPVGETLVQGLMRAQLSLALRLSLLVLVALGGLPWLFAIAPTVGRVTVLGVNLPWLLLGVVSFPFLIVVGWAYVRLAERNEQDFVDLIRRPER
ncbi:hypothetical protein O7607_13095 [Micromonospora sp. WMMA1949]|uniref:hypothetical protein n=1 Tax=unclassified Micromonospora TaxID=2617518 RepID=UPI0022B6DE7F|nr:MULTISPECIES: hypothetical protein [unclassified Micromonospora]MCZ7426673.1 hypothetical protein [Micromonospora sp. WMMA1949]WBC11196.1 hypothetical protein O7604_10100 [Micromonospora sp. WMMA1947]